jgi:hypothetical protein
MPVYVAQLLASHSQQQRTAHAIHLRFADTGRSCCARALSNLEIQVLAAFFIDQA